MCNHSHSLGERDTYSTSDIRDGVCRGLHQTNAWIKGVRFRLSAAPLNIHLARAAARIFAAENLEIVSVAQHSASLDLARAFRILFHSRVNSLFCYSPADLARHGRQIELENFVERAPTWLTSR